MEGSNFPGKETAIVNENGRWDVVEGAFADGSARLCPNCNAIIGSNRFDQHLLYWCQKLVKLSFFSITFF